jgi:hypothetical protein
MLAHSRHFDPMMGRFLQTDPIRYGDGPNIYAYTHGDPVNGTDPSGTFDPISVGTWYGGSYTAGGVLGAAGQAVNTNISLPDGSGLTGYTTIGNFVGGSGLGSSLAGNTSNAFAAGLGAGYGGGWVFTNAQSQNDYSGDFQATNLDVGALNLSLASSGNVWAFSVGVSKSWGFDFSRYTTTTAITNNQNMTPSSPQAQPPPIPDPVAAPDFSSLAFGPAVTVSPITVDGAGQSQSGGWLSSITSAVSNAASSFWSWLTGGGGGG